MSTGPSTSLPTSRYDRRMPSPPRITIPAPILESRPLLTSNSTVPAFLQHHDIANFLPPLTQAAEWKYNNRNEAQAILPFLYLGPSSAGKDAAGLTANGISYLVYLSYPRGPSAKHTPLVMTTAQNLNIDARRIDIASNQKLIASFPDAIASITQHLEQAPQGKVFVCCESGNERSAALVIALLMALFNVELVDALQYVQSRRFCVNIDDGMRQLLKSYEDILRARKDVHQAANLETQGVSGVQGSDEQPRRMSSKRFRESDEDTDMMEAEDGARFEHRSFTPFEE